MKQIASRDNATFKHLRALSEDARARRESGTTLLDGAHLVGVAIERGAHLRRIAVTARSLDNPEVFNLLSLADPTCERLELSDSLLHILSPVDAANGIVAEVEIPPPRGDAEEGDILVLAGVQDAGNLGTLLRTAAAAGIVRAWLSPDCAQVWSPKVLRAGMGAHFYLDIADRVEISDRLCEFSGQIVATALADRAQSIYALDLSKPTAWIFGSEGQGVPKPLLERADALALIPMPGGMESLNVAAAAAVCLFEQVRQRGLHSCS
ncbi:TrmH family RNA methyltransferase [Uliginosibacterium sp. sgz301328]|uniref:TrmH family RNA methyltransferase n=1 Tax=Uliginosibacterium sp. sgz301328 TaxID=3243764 RepID=UPI00359DA261